MKILIDASLSPSWADYLAGRGIPAQHWSALGRLNASDLQIMEVARAGTFVVFTHDLDFGIILATTNARGPSVIQARTQDPVPEAIGDLVVATIQQYSEILLRGALVTIEPERLRARVLPLFPKGSSV